jgi:hypothetical protein
MAGRIKKLETVPNPSEKGSALPGPGELVAQSRRRISASAAAAEALQARLDAQARVAAQQAAERAERVAVVRGVEETVALAAARGEEAQATPAGRVTLARDGLEWIRRKGWVAQPHYEAGLRFRGDYELANGTGVLSCLADVGAGGGAFGPKSGPTDAMLAARDRVAGALAALGTPELAPYVTRVAGEGVMLNDTQFVADPRRVSDHVLPCRIALDLLARHYGMIR